MLDTTHSFVMEVIKRVNRAIAESELELLVYTVGAVRKSVRAVAVAYEASIKITRSTQPDVSQAEVYWKTDLLYRDPYPTPQASFENVRWGDMLLRPSESIVNNPPSVT